MSQTQTGIANKCSPSLTLQEVRWHYGTSQRDIARALKVSQQRVSKIETTSLERLRRSTILKYLRAAGIPERLLAQWQAGRPVCL